MASATNDQRLSYGAQTTAIFFTQNRLDVNAILKAAQWQTELERVVRLQTTAGFLTADDPNFDSSYEELATTKPSGRKVKSELANLELAQQQWDVWNRKLYDILLGSITVNDAQHGLILRTYGTSNDGRGLYKWVLSIIDPDKPSVQIKRAKDLDAFSIADNATAAEIDAAWQTYDGMYEGVHANRSKPLKDKLIGAINLISMNNPVYALAVNVKLSIIKSGTGEYASLDDLRIQFIEIIAELEAHSYRARKESAFMGMHQPAGDPKGNGGKLTCGKCDLWSCKNVALGSSCILVDTKDVSKFEGRQTRGLIWALRDYMKEKGLASMKGVRIPKEWWNARRATKDAERAASNTRERGNQSDPPC